MNHERIAQDIEHWVGDAAGDVAYAMNNSRGWGGFPEEWILAIEKAKKDGVQDVSGWFADWLYNDPDFLEGLIGDRVYDKSKGNIDAAIKVLMIMKENAHAGLTKACDTLIKVWEERR